MRGVDQASLGLLTYGQLSLFGRMSWLPGLPVLLGIDPCRRRLSPHVNASAPLRLVYVIFV